MSRINPQLPVDPQCQFQIRPPPHVVNLFAHACPTRASCFLCPTSPSTLPVRTMPGEQTHGRIAIIYIPQTSAKFWFDKVHECPLLLLNTCEKLDLYVLLTFENDFVLQRISYVTKSLNDENVQLGCSQHSSISVS